MDLLTYFLLHRERDILKNEHYFPLYERHLARFVGHAVTMFEIGTGGGGSCRMWKYYFGPRSRIITIDIRDNRAFEEPQIFPRMGNQSDTTFLQQLLDEFGPPDLVCDDGSHMMPDINASFAFLFPRMSPNGTYLVEDLDGAYWPDRGGGLRHPDSFVERCKGLIDEMNAIYTNGAVMPGPTGQGICGIEGICGMSFYQMMVVIEKTSFLNLKLVQWPRPLPDQ
jgi:hypothetical protein